MNIGHDLMRRYGPRQSRDAGPRPPGMRDRVFAIVVALAGTAVIFDFSVDADLDAYLSLAACIVMVVGVVWTAVRMRQAG